MYKLIKNIDKFILVSDEEIKEGDWYLLTPKNEDLQYGETLIDDNVIDYKIITSKEEPKQTVQEYEQQGLEKHFYELKSKQETLEEVAKSKAFEFKVDYKPFETNLDYREYAEYGFEKGFIAGATWQAERMYSEEELDSLLYSILKKCFYQDNVETVYFESVKNEFENFKKK